jgi:hypothetical protein
LLDTFGGFAPFKADVTPEATLAGLLGTRKYHCLVSNVTLGVAYEKKWLSQVETSQRLLYPKVGARWWRGIVAIILLLLLNMPLFAVLSSAVIGWTIIHTMALWFIFAFMAVYGVYLSHIWARGWWGGALLWPLIILQELVLFLRSMDGYIRRTVTWKGRRVSVRTTKGTPSLVEK